MQSKPLFPKFWRRQSDDAAPQQTHSKEVPVNKANVPVESVAAPGADLPSYEDIYHAAGIMSPNSGYSIHKVVEMLNSERLRDLSNDIKRASVLMALDAAGTSVDDLLQDATHRQQALNSYEAGKKKQMEDFESRKSQENAQIEAANGAHPGALRRAHSAQSRPRRPGERSPAQLADGHATREPAHRRSDRFVREASSDGCFRPGFSRRGGEGGKTGKHAREYPQCVGGPKLLIAASLASLQLT